MSKTVNWAPLERDYEEEKVAHNLIRSKATLHPLMKNYDQIMRRRDKEEKERLLKLKKTEEETNKKTKTKTKSKSKRKKKSSRRKKKFKGGLNFESIDNPLSSTSLTNVQEEEEEDNGYVVIEKDPLNSGIDPLSIQTKEKQNSLSSHINEQFTSNFVSWDVKKKSILSKYTMSGHITVMEGFKDETRDSQIRSTENESMMSQEERTKRRLESLSMTNQTNEIKKKLEMSQEQYLKRINKISNQLKTYWKKGKRVISLRLIVRAAKDLANTSCLPFYPSQFVLVSDVLDMFGRLVFERIQEKSITIDPLTGGTTDPLPNDFTHDIVPEVAKDTCYNWLYKILCIRELIARIYIELAILPIYRFISKDMHIVALSRISRMIRGLADPLVAAYCRTYLLRKALEIYPDLKEFQFEALNDYLISFQQIVSEPYLSKIKKYQITMGEYMNLHQPSIEWICQCVAHRGTLEEFKNVLRKYQKISKNSLVLYGILGSFNPKFIVNNLLDLLPLIRKSDSYFPHYLIYQAIGNQLLLEKPPRKKTMRILNEVWKVVSKFEKIEEYLSVARVFVEYTVKYCSMKETLILMKDIQRHIRKLSKEELHQVKIEIYTIIERLIILSEDVTNLLLVEEFTKLMDVVVIEYKTRLAKRILDSFSRKGQEPTGDPLIIHLIFEQAKILHDSVNILSHPNEIRNVSNLINNYLDHVEFGKGVEKHLNFLVEARDSFSNLDLVIANLVIRALSLAMKTFYIVKKKHTRKTGAFARACLAYCFITIPSIEDCLIRLKLYSLSGQIALINGSHAQADTFFREAVTLFKEIALIKSEMENEEKFESKLVNFLQSFASLLVIVPGHPTYGAFYLIKGLFNVLKDLEWTKNSNANFKISMAFLSLFSVYAQKNFPYHITGIESNDVLYAGYKQYKEELQNYSTKLLKSILNSIYEMDDNTERGKQNQANSALELLNLILISAQFNKQMMNLVWKLYELTKKSKRINLKYFKNTLRSLSNQKGEKYFLLYRKIKEDK
ncbi:esophageal cancer associated protein [Anaeramoeba flamelloides]|uniref:Esophageal cancer associated protein n=1 Tax=Anaeramoeba flamelloides TaxID=1746091 RepID=A0AAV7ZB92_9EUKA|nr:esophageal cancer associated protein [Anaeramoeba flamelloides]